MIAERRMSSRHYDRGTREAESHILKGPSQTSFAIFNAKHVLHFNNDQEPDIRKQAYDNLHGGPFLLTPAV